MTTITRPSTWSTKNNVGLGLGIFFSVANIPSALTPSPGGDVGPPMSILIACSILGVVIITLTSLPAFFVDVPAVVRKVVAVSVLLTVAIVVLTLSPQRRAAA